MKVIDFNSRVKIKLTERGRQYFKERFYSHLNEESRQWYDKHLTEDEYVDFQLWDLMRTFGSLFEDISEGIPFSQYILIEDSDVNELTEKL